MSTTAARNQLNWFFWPIYLLVLALALVAHWDASFYFGRAELSNTAVSIVSPIGLKDSPSRRQSGMPENRAKSGTTQPAQRAQPFARLQARWESVWSIDVASAEQNEDNIDRALDLRAQAERGDLEAVVELIGAASWCASAGPLASQRESADGTRPPPCAERFGADIASHDALEWAIFRWTMMLANAGFHDATLYASVRGRDLLFAPSSASETEDVESLRSQLIGQLQSLALTGSADAASELNGYYMRAVETGGNGAEQARYYAKLTEHLDPARTGLVEVTDDWIVTRARVPG